MVQTDIYAEYTDTFAGEANYSWVRRATIRGEPGADFSDLAAVRRAKKAIGLSGVPCRREEQGDTIALYPYGSHSVLFISFHSHGSCQA
jgi:hypothetical protein